MKRLLLSAAIVAITSPAWGQVQADRDQDASRMCSGPSIDNETGDIIVKSCNPLPFYTDLITVTADRLGYSRVDEVTVPVSIITEDEIRARNQSVVADLLRTVPGLAVSQHGGAGSLTQIRLRGSEANHVVVIIDGVEVANPADGAFDFGGLRTGDIVKIEILRGEQSALYGSDAVGGVINIITRTGNTSESWRAGLEGGSQDTFEGQLSAIISLGGAALSVNGNAFTTDGFDISGLDGEADGKTLYQYRTEFR